MVGTILVVDVLTCALIHFVCDLKSSTDEHAILSFGT